LKPTIAIIIPCRNEEGYIYNCINSILNSNYPKDKYDIYVCDGLSEDSTRNIIDELSLNNNNVHLIDNIKRTTPYALNLGIRSSKADIKIILGAHAEIAHDFLDNNIISLDEHLDAQCVGGIIENVYEDKRSKIIGQAMSSTFGVGNAHFRTGNKDGYVDTVAFGAYRSEVFDKVGYFDEDLTRNQDDEFNYRLLKNGMKIYLSSKIISKYFVRGTFTKLIKQYYQYGYWKVYVNKKHSAITTIRQLIPFLFLSFVFLLVLQLIDFFFIGLIAPSINIFSVMILALYFILGFYFAFKKTGINKDVFLVLYTFLLLHFSYGYGYLSGLIDFVIFNKKPKLTSARLTR
jgi:glycosyltransferase involved in cell wall biosynthesis